MLDHEMLMQNTYWQCIKKKKSEHFCFHFDLQPILGFAVEYLEKTCFPGSRTSGHMD